MCDNPQFSTKRHSASQLLAVADKRSSVVLYLTLLVMNLLLYSK